MANECTTRTPHLWWDYTIPSSWHIPNPSCHNNINNNTNNSSSCDQDDDISRISTTSFTTIDDSSPELVDHPVGSPSYVFIEDSSSDTNLWTNVLVQDVNENYLDAMSSRSSLSLSESGIFDEHGGACDYLKKMDTINTWELTNSANSSLSNLDKYFNLGFVDNNFTNEVNNRLSNKMASLACNSAFDSQPSHVSLNSSSINRYLTNEDLCPNSIRPNRMSDLNSSYYDHDMNVNINDHDHDKIEPAMGYLTGGSFYDKYYSGLSDSSCMNGRGFEEKETFFKSKSRKSLVDFHACKPSNYKKQRPYVTSLVKGKNNGRAEGNSIEGSKKKRVEDNNSEIVIKKPTQENSTASSSVKMQPPKVKLGEKINALQQIVSPFGKTDTASVLFEAIEFIKCLQEQVQLLSNPYMKGNVNKDPWASMEWNDRDKKPDLKSKGLCLVPISSTPQIYCENTVSDYWTPTYRGCLYR